MDQVNPTGTPACGSMYIRTNALTGHSGFRVYNTVDGAVETGLSSLTTGLEKFSVIRDISHPEIDSDIPLAGEVSLRAASPGFPGLFL